MKGKWSLGVPGMNLTLNPCQANQCSSWLGALGLEASNFATEATGGHFAEDSGAKPVFKKIIELRVLVHCCHGELVSQLHSRACSDL